MAKKNEEDSAPVSDAGSDPASAQAAPPVESAAPTDPAIIEAIERQNRQIDELARLTTGLAELVAQGQAQSQRDAAFLSAVESVRSASASVAAGAVFREVAQADSAAHVAAAPNPHPAERGDCSEGGLCECTAPDCCCFEIVMTGVRVLGMQPLELEDSPANPWADIEVQMFAYLDGGIGAVIPSLFSTIPLGKLIQHPGNWVTIERRIGIICLPKGRTRLVRVHCDAIESDKGLLERLTGGRDEEGSGSGMMQLDCCCSAEPTLVFDVQFTAGGQGGGAIEVAFAARRTC